MTQALPGERPGSAGQADGRPIAEPAKRHVLSHPFLTASRDALLAEWLKLRTVSNSAWLLAGIIVLTVAIGAAAVAANRCPPGLSCSVDTVKLSLTGIQFGQAVVAIFAVLPVCNEYSTGMIRVTLAAMPRRPAVLAAKTVIVGGLALTAGAAAILGSFMAARLMLPGQGFSAAHGFRALSLADSSTLRAAAGSVLYIGLVALLSSGVAAMVRDSAPTIGVVLGMLYVFPVIDALVANPTWHRRLERYSPMAGLNIQATTGLKGLAIGPWAGLGVLVIWAAVALLAGGLTMALRDA
jgi:ABC-2 type transport system permease protein